MEPDEPPHDDSLGALIEKTELELTRYLRWTELSLDNGAPSATVLTILDEAIGCIQTVLACANSFATSSSHDSSLATGAAEIIQTFSELQRLRAELAQATSNKEASGREILLCMAQMQSLMPQLVARPSTPEDSKTRPMTTGSSEREHAKKGGNGKRADKSKGREGNRSGVDVLEREQIGDEDSGDESDESDVASDEEVIRMNESFATGTAPSQLGRERHRRHMTDGRHVDGPLSMGLNDLSGDSEQGGSEPEEAFLDYPTEWFDFRALNDASPPAPHAGDMLPAKLSRKMPRMVPALALHTLRSNYSDESSTPRSAPSAPNSARLMISPRSAFDSVPSHRSSNTESDYGPISVRSGSLLYVDSEPIVSE